MDFDINDLSVFFRWFVLIPVEGYPFYRKPGIADCQLRPVCLILLNQKPRILLPEILQPVQTVPSD